MNLLDLEISKCMYGIVRLNVMLAQVIPIAQHAKQVIFYSKMYALPIALMVNTIINPITSALIVKQSAKHALIIFLANHATQTTSTKLTNVILNVLKDPIKIIVTTNVQIVWFLVKRVKIIMNAYPVSNLLFLTIIQLSNAITAFQ